MKTSLLQLLERTVESSSLISLLLVGVCVARWCARCGEGGGWCPATDLLIRPRLQPSHKQSSLLDCLVCCDGATRRWLEGGKWAGVGVLV